MEREAFHALSSEASRAVPCSLPSPPDRRSLYERAARSRSSPLVRSDGAIRRRASLEERRQSSPEARCGTLRSEVTR